MSPTATLEAEQSPLRRQSIIYYLWKKVNPVKETIEMEKSGRVQGRHGGKVLQLNQDRTYKHGTQKEGRTR